MSNLSKIQLYMSRINQTNFTRQIYQKNQILHVKNLQNIEYVRFAFKTNTKSADCLWK